MINSDDVEDVEDVIPNNVMHVVLSNHATHPLADSGGFFGVCHKYHEQASQ